MAYTVVEGAIFAAGLDPQLGLLHADTKGKATLSFDLIEPFRPWIDRLLTEECLKGNIKKNFFTSNQYGVTLNKHGKAYVIPLFHKFMRTSRKFEQKELSNKNQIYHFAGKLSNRITTFQQTPLHWIRSCSTC